MDVRRYEGRVAIVTGASGGIGRATALRLAGEGARVLLADLASTPLEEAAAEVSDAGTEVETLAVDVTEPEQMEAMVARAEEAFGGLDLLVNNAGIEGVMTGIEDYPLEVFDQVFAVNVRGVFLGMRFAAPALRRRGGGAIVNVASVAGLTGDPNLSVYCASKHAVIGLTRSGAISWASEGVRVNAVCPSPVETRMMRSIEQGMGGEGEGAEAIHKMISERIPVGRYAEPAEIASLIAFVGSDEARFINGSIYTIDGGMTPH
jgi:NAD(P)-dependent dehydrogenase (short-subunit alcohol dehydrogenase family)